MVYAVIDTNVIVASLLTKHHDSATARVMDAVFSGKVIPLLNDEIIAEYREVLHRKRLGFSGTQFIVKTSGALDISGAVPPWLITYQSDMPTLCLSGTSSCNTSKFPDKL